MNADGTPYGCADCGTPAGHHGSRWSRTAGLHKWIKPSSALILQRMKVRREGRKP